MTIASMTPSSILVNDENMPDYGNTNNTRASQTNTAMTSIESSFERNTFQLPEIPPFNPNSKKRQSTTSTREVAEVLSNKPVSRIPASHQTTHRPASTTVVPITPATPDQAYPSSRPTGAAHTTSAKNRASHTVVVAPTTVSGYPPQNQGIGIATFSPHVTSGRPKIYFGPYQLLQTLGEGEFGKVKLGVKGDARWGEEVAIKLIKRGNLQDSAQRMAKVMREIEALKIVKHPNIVRLHDVIETEKYIGIVLEYASGGELFDHILAHRYLKDRDASRLFAQLISGVAYLHAKKIVHRDLKLENLLLDRNRNIIVTDFGFANRFEGKADDLMSTSCGSPCYAAPELVVQDGRYVGTAVDVWSCGVILYAMLAGYLPFDDDPANPDSENINLLYKYIINTPLSFPDWITPEPRDLLHKMLVPDPSRRCSLADVARHPWLRRYASMFDMTVEQLEAFADEQQERKRMMLERQREAILTAQENPAQMTRSQSTANPAASNRHYSAMVTSTTSRHVHAPPAGSSRSSRPAAQAQASQQSGSSSSSADRRRAHAQSAIVMPSVANTVQPSMTTEMAVADPFSFDRGPISEAVPMSFSASAPLSSMALEPSLTPAPLTTALPPIPTRAADDAQKEEEARKKRTQAHRYTVQVEYDSNAARTREQASRSGPVTRSSSKQQALSLSVTNLDPVVLEQVHDEPKHSPSDSMVPEDGHHALALNRDTIEEEPKTPTTMPSPVPFPSPEKRIASQRSNVAMPHSKQVSVTRSDSVSSAQAPSVISSHAPSKHKKGNSTDRFSMTRFLGSSNTSLDKHSKQAATEDTAAAAAASTKRKASTRRKAFSMVVEPFRGTKSDSKSGKHRDTRIPKPEEPLRVRTPTVSAASPSAPVVTPSSATRASPRKPAKTTATQLTDPVWLNKGPPATKAKRVMDWFRLRSIPKEQPIVPTVQGASDRPVTREHLRNSIAIQQKLSASQSQRPATTTPRVVVSPTVDVVAANEATEDASLSPSTPQTPSAPPTEEQPAVSLQRGLSVSSTATVGSAFTDSKLRYHSGAVDQTALTSRSPPLVLADLLKVLWNLGVEAREENSPFRLKCVRLSSRRAAAAHGVPVSSVHAAATSTAGPVASLSASTSTTGMTHSPSGSLRAFFARRGSTLVSASAPTASPALSVTSDTPELLSASQGSSATTQSGNMPLPFYGENDTGAEIRFTVEISRIKGLPNLYAIDIRRLKGNLWAYRAIYQQVIQRLELSV